MLHVVGNRDWAERCGIKHIQNLARPIKKSPPTLPKSPGHKYESPWEEILFKALVKKKLEPIPQFPVAGRRLDLALLRNGSQSVKIDIEVDGDRYHRNPDGTRKHDDVWRDIQLQGMGWQVMRFWVYQLREDLNKCVEEIEKKWSEHA
ncbi:MAG: endonuclease domain-containing protein [bacterium]